MPTINILSTSQIAERLGVTRRTVNRLVERGEFPNARKLGGGRNSAYLIPEPDVLAYEKKLASASQKAKAS